MRARRSVAVREWRDGHAARDKARFCVPTAGRSAAQPASRTRARPCCGAPRPERQDGHATRLPDHVADSLATWGLGVRRAQVALASQLRNSSQTARQPSPHSGLRLGRPNRRSQADAKADATWLESPAPATTIYRALRDSLGSSRISLSIAANQVSLSKPFILLSAGASLMRVTGR